MAEKFHKELRELKNGVSGMGRLSEVMLTKSIESFEQHDLDLAEWVFQKKKEVAGLDVQIEEKALQMIALNQPMARDMRTIACTLKAITYLARIGRNGKDIATIVKKSSDQPPLDLMGDITRMSKKTASMIDDALKAYEAEDISPLKKFNERDDEVDELWRNIFLKSYGYMQDDTGNIERCLNYIMVSRYLERCADHACKMAEKVHYMVTGEHIEIK